MSESTHTSPDDSPPDDSPPDDGPASDGPASARPAGAEATNDFAAQYARTQRFTLGEPRNLALFDRFALFLRSDTGDDATHHLWGVDLDTGAETKLVDARQLGRDDAELPAAERARRERLREGGAGITAYATDRSGRVIAFALSGRLYRATLSDDLYPDDPERTRSSPGDAPERKVDIGPIDTADAVFDPRPSPDGSLIAFVSEQRFIVVDLNGTVRAEIATDDPNVSWGSADFIAAEEMGRYRGFWWSPVSDALAVCRNDVSVVQQWWISEPADPSAAPVSHRYPKAGTANPAVELYLIALGSGDTPPLPVPVTWDRERYEYLASVEWNNAGLVIGLQSRDQRSIAWCSVHPATGAVVEWVADADEHWVELVPGGGVARSRPADTGPKDGTDATAIGSRSASAELITAADRDGSRRLMVDGAAVTPTEIQVRSIVAVDADGILMTGNPVDDSTVVHLYRWADGECRALTTEPGIHTAVGTSQHFAVRRSNTDVPGSVWTLPGGHRLDSTAISPPVVPRPTFLRSGRLDSATAVLLPTDHDGSPLPVLLDPYGGPHALRALRSYQALSSSQWFADQGFAVVITDGRGTPGRGTAYERAVFHDLAWGVLDDQVAGLHAAADRVDGLDLGRVAIRGWSFGGYLAALAVLARPDVFHVAVAGAPVTDWRWYDTHYTERYLGDPTLDADPYDRCSLLGLAPDLQRPLLLIHGLADDNVVAAHTLALSSALLAAGRPHEVLPLSGVTHMTPQVDVARNLLLLQLDFIRRNLPTPAIGGEPIDRQEIDPLGDRLSETTRRRR